MITWFDALLVTLWAAATALGARRGLVGSAWALGLALLVVVLNTLPAIVAVPVAALAGVGLAALTQRLTWVIVPQAWHVVVGGVAGFAVGFALIAALALSFPIKVIGSQGTYPSDSLPPFLYYAVSKSLVVRDLSGFWMGGRLVRQIWLPDQVR